MAESLRGRWFRSLTCSRIDSTHKRRITRFAAKTVFCNGSAPMARKDSTSKVDRRNFLKGVAVAGAAAGAVAPQVANANSAAGAAAARVPSALPPTARTIAAGTGTAEKRAGERAGGGRG